MRDPRRRHHPEFKIHVAICDHLRLRANPDALWLHVPNQRKTDAKTGALLKRMGVLSGASDFLLWHQGNSFSLEVKSPGTRPTDAQRDFMARFANAGGHTCIAVGIDEALGALDAWGILRGRSS
jgi:VRR-NUC domain